MSKVPQESQKQNIDQARWSAALSTCHIPEVFEVATLSRRRVRMFRNSTRTISPTLSVPLPRQARACLRSSRHCRCASAGEKVQEFKMRETFWRPCLHALRHPNSRSENIMLCVMCCVCLLYPDTSLVRAWRMVCHTLPHSMTSPRIASALLRLHVR